MSDIKSLLLGGPSTPEEIEKYKEVLVAFATKLAKELPDLDKEHRSLYTKEPTEYVTKTIKIAMPSMFWDTLNEILLIHKTRSDMEIVFNDDSHSKELDQATNNVFANSEKAAGGAIEGTASNLLMESILDFSYKIAEAHLKNEISQAIIDNNVEKLYDLLQTVIKLGFAPPELEEGLDEFSMADDDGDETEN